MGTYTCQCRGSIHKKAKWQVLRLWSPKAIVHQTTTGLAYIHRCFIAHTALAAWLHHTCSSLPVAHLKQFEQVLEKSALSPPLL